MSDQFDEVLDRNIGYLSGPVNVEGFGFLLEPDRDIYTIEFFLGSWVIRSHENINHAIHSLMMNGYIVDHIKVL